MRTIKELKLFGCLLMCGICFSPRVKAQADELQQLALNIEKLTQFKAILSDMKKGYQIYQQGYGLVSNLSKGNFSLHNVYLNGLMVVNPVVGNNPRIRQIIGQQQGIMSEYKRYTDLFRQSGTFKASELGYIQNVYQQLVKQSDANTTDLINITTAGKLRMSDDDRLRAIERIYNNSADQLQFLRYFNRRTAILSIQRTRDRNNNLTLRKLYGIN